MQNLFERSNVLNEPIECFLFDAKDEVFPVKSHWHYFAELIFMRSGTAVLTADGTAYTLSEGDLFIVPPAAVHAISAPEGVLPVYEVLKFDLAKFPSRSSYSPSPDSIFRYVRAQGMQLCFRQAEAVHFGCAEIFADCIREAHSLQFGYDLMLRAQIYRLIYRIIRRWTALGLDLTACADRGAHSGSIDRVTEYIDSHLSEPLRVQEIAAHCHLSYSAFAVHFRSYYGMSCKEYIERMRIFKAEEYLLFTDLDIREISEVTGFSDSSHLIRCFRRFRGVTPKQFRTARRSAEV